MWLCLLEYPESAIPLLALPTPFLMGNLLSKEEGAGPILQGGKPGRDLGPPDAHSRALSTPSLWQVQHPPCLQDSLPPSQLLRAAGVAGDRTGLPHCL